MNRWVKALTAALLFGVLAACGGDDDPAPVTPDASGDGTCGSIESFGGTGRSSEHRAVVGGTDRDFLHAVLVGNESCDEGDGDRDSQRRVTLQAHGADERQADLLRGRRAGTPAVESELSSVIGAMPVAPVPAAPMSVNASSGNAAVALAWSPVSGADSYSIYWSKTAGVVPGAAGVTKIPSVAATSYTHTGLTNGDTLLLHRHGGEHGRRERGFVRSLGDADAPGTGSAGEPRGDER